MAAFMASAYFSQVGYDADRKDAAEEDKASALVAKRLEEQNALMRELLEQSKKRPNTGAEQRDSVPNAGKGPAPLLEQKK